MNPAAGCTAQRQSCTLIAALRTRVADQSSDACQYFRIIVEGCSLLVFLSLFLFLLPFIPSIPFLLLHIQLLSSSFMSSPLLLRVCTQSQTRVSRGKPNDVQNRVFLKRPDDALMRPGLCGWTEATDFARDRHE